MALEHLLPMMRSYLEQAHLEGVRAGLEAAAKACVAERLWEPQDESDSAYDNAISHCAQAIRSIDPETLK